MGAYKKRIIANIDTEILLVDVFIYTGSLTCGVDI